MRYNLEFDRRVEYDNGQSGISLNVELRLGDISVDIIAKIDTGSSFCIFGREVGEELGIEISEGFPQRFRTATGSFPAYGHWVTLIVDQFEFDSQVFFCDVPGFYPNVLGRQGWLDRVNMAIVDHRGELYLSAIEEI